MSEKRYTPPKNMVPSNLELDWNSYLVDTCTWIDIASQIYSLRYSKYKRHMTGINDPSIEVIVQRMGLSDKTLYCSEIIRKEYSEKMKDPEKPHLIKIDNDIKEQVMNYMKSVQDCYLFSKLKSKLVNGESYGNDREIFLSGRVKLAGNVITQNTPHFSHIFDQMYDIYNPNLWNGETDDYGIFSGLHMFKEHKKINENFYSLARRVIRIFENWKIRHKRIWF